jgi:hypothetical protein
MHWVFGLISLGRPLTQAEIDAFEMPPDIEYVQPPNPVSPKIQAILDSLDLEGEDGPPEFD